MSTSLCLLFLLKCAIISANSNRDNSHLPTITAPPNFNNRASISLFNEFNRNRYTVSLYLHRRINDVCSIQLVYRAIGVPGGPPEQLNPGPQLEIDSTRTLVVLIHGLNSGPEQQFPDVMAKALCLKGNNVVVVDWKELATGGWLLTLFSRAVNYIPIAGLFVSNFLTEMDALGKLDPANTHLIGHSLGSYVASYAARGYQDTIHKISRITMLDPPTIFGIGVHHVVQLTDAHYIQTSDFTKVGRMGHVDFYVNPTLLTQHGCLANDIFLSFGSRRRSSGFICSHSFVHRLFLETIEFDYFVSGKFCRNFKEGFKDWGSCMCLLSENAYMGFGFSWPNVFRLGKVDVVPGFYILETNNQRPFIRDNCPSWPQ